MPQNGRMLGVIGGRGFYSFFGTDARTVTLDTPYGLPSGPITFGIVGDREVAFLPRHGHHRENSPHAVPYRANMWALRSLGVRRIFGPCTVGSRTATLRPGAVVVPDPYCPGLRSAVTGLGEVADGGTLINLTGCPESALAREFEMCYAAIALVADPDAESQHHPRPFQRLVFDALGRVTGTGTCAHCRTHVDLMRPVELP